MRYIIPISGKDSLATAIVQMRRQPDLPYEFMFNPTGAEYEEVFDWLDRVEIFLGSKIIHIGEDLKSIIEDYNYFLPSSGARYCTRRAKIEPMEKWLGQDECCIYYGIRADENRVGYENASGRITSILPLVEEDIGIEGVYDIITTHNLKPPSFFWTSVYKEVERRIGGGLLIRELLRPWQLDLLFAGRTRANCNFCWGQRLYEWVWCSETHPDLFWEAEKMEHLGGDDIFTWNSGRSLKWIWDNRRTIKKDRIDEVVKIIRRLSQGEIFFDGTEGGFKDILSVTSCGLFCGK